MERKIISFEDSPLVEIGNDFDRFNHLLKRRDRVPVELVSQYLHLRGMDVYLGGSVVSNWIFTGERNYSDVDILGVARSEETRFELVRDLLASVGGNNFILGSTFFRVRTPCDLERQYMQGGIDERFILKPEGLWIKPSAIDVSLVSKEKFSQSPQANI